MTGRRRRTLEEALDLAAHYLPATASPGNLLRLLELVARPNRRGVASGSNPETVIGTLSDATGPTAPRARPAGPLSLDRVRPSSTTASSGSRRRSTCLVERIALVKAGLTDPTRPLGVFLFVGPTGTGKTEIAKAFSAFVFGSDDRLVRLDMSEYQTPESLERLLGDANASSGGAAHRPGPQATLLGPPPRRVREGAPHDLGPLPPGLRRRSPDRPNGRTVDLRHCVIILTSNLGSAIPVGPGLGFVGRSSEFDAAAVPSSSSARSDPSS